MKLQKVNGIQVADLVTSGLFIKQRVVIPLWVTMPYYGLRWTTRTTARLLVRLARIWPVSVPVLASSCRVSPRRC